MAKLIKNMFDPKTNPSYGGQVKPTTPPIKKIEMPTVHERYYYQRDSEKADAKFNRGAAKPWKPKGIPAKSKGSTNIVGEGPSQRRNDPKGILKKGYKKK